MTYINSALIFLSNTVFDLYIMVFLVRMLMFRFAAYYAHPICDFFYRATDPVLKLFKAMPVIWGFETGAIVCIYLLIILKVFFAAILSGYFPQIGGLLILSIAFFVSKLFNLYFFLVLIFVVASWISPLLDSAVIQVIARMVNPLLFPIRRIVPLIGGIDISPLILIILIQTLKIAIAYPLIEWGVGLVGG